MLFVCQPKILHEALFSVSLNYFNSFLTPKEKLKTIGLCNIFGRQTKRALWYVMVLSVVVNRPFYSCGLGALAFERT